MSQKPKEFLFPRFFLPWFVGFAVLDKGPNHTGGQLCPFSHCATGSVKSMFPLFFAKGWPQVRTSSNPPNSIEKKRRR
jgi:hypothetical protein